jgi:hypothetical protein
MPSGPAALMDTLQPWVVPRYKQWGPSRKRRLEPDAEGGDDNPLSPAAVSATPAQMMYASKGVFPLLADVARGDGHLYGISCACQKTKSGKSGSGGGGGVPGARCVF